ncbi:MAG: hypothetical protein WAT39_16505 [Planctomycetota bacterium]
MRSHDIRLDHLRRTLAKTPVLPHIVGEAYEWFWMFGELPDDEHVAEAVVQRALRGGQITYTVDDRDPHPYSVRDRLFQEALYEPHPHRDIARWAIAVEVAWGGNVQSPGFAARHGMPMHGSVAMHMLGYPRKWVRPPYEEQANRLFARGDDIRARLNHDNAEWFGRFAEKIEAFKTKGTLPDDDIEVEALLAFVELDAIIAHKKGRDVAEVMKLYDEIARSDDEQREAALARLCAMAKEGRVP